MPTLHIGMAFSFIQESIDPTLIRRGCHGRWRQQRRRAWRDAPACKQDAVAPAAGVSASCSPASSYRCTLSS
jgi:hypothetical protein